MTEEIHIGDVGTKFLITVKNDGVVVDISSATVKEIYFEKPDGTTLTKTASFETDGTDGKIYWTTSAAGDLDIEGMWKIQAKIAITGGSWKTEIGSFRVWENIL
jgi:hypothetical protein